MTKPDSVAAHPLENGQADAAGLEPAGALLGAAPEVPRPRPEIPLQRPFLTGRESDYLRAVCQPDRIVTDGGFAQRCARLLEERLGLCRVVLTPSCTAALEAAARLLELGPGDEVILPSFTFTSTANAVLLAGATPVFVDIRPDTLNLDERRIEEAITPQTRAIIPVHYAGVACEMDAIRAIAVRHGLAVVEDAAQAVCAFYKGRPLGGLGDLGAFSFHYTKNFMCGEGGALCINTPDLELPAFVYRDKGTNRRQFVLGQVDKYSWVGLGSSVTMGALPAAFLLAQLEAMEVITERRRVLYDAYRSALAPLERAGWLRLPVIPETARSNYHLFHIVLNDAGRRPDLLAYLAEQGIEATIHFVPLHSAPMGRACCRSVGTLAVTEHVGAALVRLPFYAGMTGSEQERVIDRLFRFFEGR